ncbi:MAG: DMT family transporter [Chitinophagaceae bacterium]
MKSLWIVMALIAGVFLPIQGGLNSRMGKEIASPVHAAFISFIVGAAGLFIYILLTRQHVELSSLKKAPLYLWSGGLLGAFYVTVIVLAFPRIGPALTFGLVVAGQMITSLILGHFNILVDQPNPINAWKVFGVLLIIIGVVILRKS